MFVCWKMADIADWDEWASETVPVTIVDPLAMPMVGDPGVIGSAIVTTAADGNIEAVVNLGAGFDTRAFRLPALAEVPEAERLYVLDADAD